MANALFRFVFCLLFYEYAFKNPEHEEKCWAVKGLDHPIPEDTTDAVDVTKRFNITCIMLFTCLLIGAIVSCSKNALYYREKHSLYLITNKFYIVFINVEGIVCIISSVWRYN